MHDAHIGDGVGSSVSGNLASMTFSSLLDDASHMVQYGSSSNNSESSNAPLMHFILSTMPQIKRKSESQWLTLLNKTIQTTCIFIGLPVKDPVIKAMKRVVTRPVS